MLHQDAIRALASDQQVMGRLLQPRAEAVTQEAKRLAPVSPAGEYGRPSGWLRSHIGWEFLTDHRGLFARVHGDAFTPEGFNYGLAMEVGTKAHTITPKSPGYPLRGRGGQVFGYLVHHPGTKPYAFLRGALAVLRGH